MLATGNSDLQNCTFCLLNTMQREVPFSRSKGIDPDVFDMPFDEAQGYMDESARDCLGYYEPRVSVEGLDFEFGEDNEGSDMAYSIGVAASEGEDDGEG